MNISTGGIRAYLHTPESAAWRPIQLARPHPAPAVGPGGVLFIALRGGEVWIKEAEACACLGIDPAAVGYFTDPSERKRLFVVTAAHGQEADVYLSECGFHVAAVIAALRLGSPARQVHRWAVLELLPHVRAASGAEAAAASRAGHALGDFVRSRLPRSQEKSIASLLAYLWANNRDGKWLNVGWRPLANVLDMNAPCLERALKTLVGWGVVERRPGADVKSWPDGIRLDAAALLAAMAAAGIDPAALLQEEAGEG